MIEALYIHIPFCTSRCAYCDFATSACHDEAEMDAYTDALGLQLRRASKAGLLGSVKTIYIGGGTPTHLGARRLNSLVYLISLSVNLEDVDEFTVECNPESLTARMVKDLFALGVSRFSLGAQSFDECMLAAYGRAHTAAQIGEALQPVFERGADASLDLICGGPGQTLAMWEDDLRQAVALGVDHVSIYPLMVEEGTPLAARVEAGEWDGPDEDLQAEMMEAAERILGAAGLVRYEVASYARPGHESRHNRAYWSGTGYLGLGAAAASMLDAGDFTACVEAGLFGELDGDEPAADTVRIRVSAAADSAAFAAALGRPAAELECLDTREALLEDVMLAFRKSDGLPAELEERACAAVPELAQTFEDLQAKGLVARAGECLASTERGWLMGNEIFSAIWDLA